MTVNIEDKFGRLTVTSQEFRRPAAGKAGKKGWTRSWVTVLCVCGTSKDVQVSNLKTGNTTSCGCYHSERVSQIMAVHGATKGAAVKRPRDRIYSIWRGMRQRCNNPHSSGYKWYGGKGVQVCPEWDDFKVFREWANAHGYANGLELDREDSDKNYAPFNCRWVTKKFNLRNRDMCWSDELDAKLVALAHHAGVNPYAVIASAVAEYLGG